MPPHAIRVKTSTGWQDIAVVGPQGPPGTSGMTPVTDATIPTDPSAGDMILYMGAIPPVPYYWNGVDWVEFGGAGGGGGSNAFAFLMGDSR